MHIYSETEQWVGKRWAQRAWRGTVSKRVQVSRHWLALSLQRQSNDWGWIHCTHGPSHERWWWFVVANFTISKGRPKNQDSLERCCEINTIHSVGINQPEFNHKEFKVPEQWQSLSLCRINPQPCDPGRVSSYPANILAASPSESREEIGPNSNRPMGKSRPRDKARLVHHQATWG